MCPAALFPRQPFFTRWDVIFNTVMTRDEANAYSKKRPVGSSVETEILEIEAKCMSSLSCSQAALQR